MINLVLGVPGSGKSYQARRWAERSIQRGYTVLWLSPLNSEKQRLYHYFSERLDPDQVRLLPTKPEKCPIMNQLARNMPTAYPLLSAALCKVCRLRDSCPFYKEIHEILEDIKARKPVLYIGGFSYIWLAALISRVVVDEFDQLYPQMYKAIPRELVEGILKLLEGVDKEAARELEKRISPSPFGDGYLLRPPSIAEMFLDRGTLYLISATYSHDTYKPDPRLILGIEDEDALNLSLVPQPPRADHFIVQDTVIYAANRAKYVYYKRIARRAREDKERIITLIARSKKEARVIHHYLEKEGLEPLTESVNWDKKNQWEWRRRRVRVLVIGGLFHRSLDIDSDVVYAFYQHPPPDYPRNFSLAYPDAVAIDPEAHVIPVMRSHVQTLFRATRAWTRSHEVYLLDRTWLQPLRYYPHVWDFVAPRMVVEKNVV